MLSAPLSGIGVQELAMLLLLLLHIIVLLLHSNLVDAKCSIVRYRCAGAGHAVVVAAPDHSAVAPFQPS